MWLKTVILLLGISFLYHDYALAQEKPRYENIESYSTSSRFTQFMYRLFYKPIASTPVPTDSVVRPPKAPYSAFEGKTIRNIDITTLDPFGYSLGDTAAATTGFLSTLGNRFHITTRESILRHLLLMKEDQVFDSLLVRESERLVRTGKHLTDVALWVKAGPENADSVDISIRQLDKWSILPGGTFNDELWSFRLGDDNFLGLGHSFQNEIIRNRPSGEYDFTTKYHIPNIHNTFIHSTLMYGSSQDGNYVRSVALERPFITPFME
ncbi:hypothetical protein [Geofilum rubicundum]|uniref:Uncharacterized protein n=1 Tax=Geofilum rubicundum JCM 15548 TaxID=1236989 RepID=A0A0E9M0Y4_9BACT|nr:hypothetical protein [Geofilum rubicundum]GAO31462.1 hypothetical protein JCM15548_13826 [Geofilum rubicundum JCM 15548]